MSFSKYYDAKTDFAFKRIFGTDKNKKLLLSFLNAVLKKQISSEISDVTFLKASQDPETAASKQSLVDVLCKDKNGVQYIIEMQIVKNKGFEERAQYYACRAYIDQMKAGQQYEDLKEVIFIAIADYNVFPNKKKYKSEHMILDRHSHERDLNKLSFTFIDLTKFDKEERELTQMTLEEKWYYFLKNAGGTEDQELNALVGEDAIILEAYKEVDRFNYSEEERNAYEHALKHQRYEEAVVKQKIIDAEEKGIKEGIKKGIKEGIKKGIKEGIKEGVKKEKLAIARTLLLEGSPMDFIVKITGLSQEEIKEET